ncbi:MAG TPA: DUF6159 family protein [Acidimicrobiia bacterium]|jgi:hypothetical protein
MTRMQRSWALAKSSWAVLKSEKGLLWLPVLSFIGSAVVVGIFALAVWATLGKDTGLNGDTEYHANVVTYLLGFCTYIGVAFVQTYFLAALCAGANERLQGRDTTLGMALGVAQTRLHRILPWAVLSATVSVIIQAIEERFGFLGRIIGSLIGAAWNVVTFLSVPIIVFEDVGPITALKRSAHLLKQTWGENLAAQIGLGLIGLIAFIPGLAVIFLGVAAGDVLVTVPLIAVGAVLLAVAMSIVAALSGIYRTALYRYAVDGQVPQAFATTDLEHAFGRRKSVTRGFGAGPSSGSSGFASPSSN